MTRWIKVKTHKRNLHRLCVTKFCNRDGRVTATSTNKVNAIRMDGGPWCLECATEGGVLKEEQ